MMLRSRLDRSFRRYRRHGDPRALAAVFDRAAPELWKVAACLCRDRHAVEDAVQGTFLTAIECQHEWDEARPVLPWLLGILVHRVHTERRRQRREPDADRLTVPRGERDPVELAAAGEVHASLRTALRELAEPYRSALEQHLVAQRSAAELASEQGLSPGAMRMRLHRGLDLLRRRLPASLAAVPYAVPLTPASRAAMRAAVLGDTVLAPAAVVTGALGLGLVGWLAVPAAVLVAALFVFSDNTMDTSVSPAAVMAMAAAQGERAIERPAAQPVEPVLEPAEGAGRDPIPRVASAEARPVERESVATSGRLRVVVTKQDDGAPVALARVDVLPGRGIAANPVPNAAPSEPGGHLAPPDAQVVSVAASDVLHGETDADGVAAFDVPAGPVVVQVNAPALARHEVAIEADREAECRFELPAHAVADVFVVDAEGRPVKAARILGRKGVYLGTLDEIELGHTDAQGHWRATFVETSVLVRAVRDGDAASDAAVVGGHAKRTTLRLKAPAATLRGTVIALDGRPVPGAGVAIRSAVSPVPLVVRSGDDGAFVCDYVTPGPCLVYAWCVEHARQRFAVAEVEAVAQAATRVDVRFVPGASVVAEALRPDGSAIAGVSVLATPEQRLGAGFDLGGSAHTGAGRCVIDGLLPGRYELRAVRGSDVRTETVELVAGQAYRFASVFDAPAEVELEVVDAEGSPLVGWWVDVVAADLDPRDRTGELSARTGDDGRARLRGVPGRRLFASVRRQPRGLAVHGQEIEPDRSTRLVVNDPCSGTVRGVIVPAVGAPLPDLLLELVRMPDAAATTAFDPRERSDGAMAPDGSFTFGGMPAGHYVFGAFDRGASRLACWRMGIELHQGGLVDLGRIEVAPGTIRVHASRADGRAVDDLVVLLGRRGDGAFGGFGGDAGAGGELQGLAPADYDVLVWGADIAPTRVPVTLAAGAVVELPVVAPVAIPVTFRCVDLPESAAFGSVRLLHTGDAEVAYLLPDARAAHTRGLLPGSYRFEFIGGARGASGLWVAEFEVGSAPVTVRAERAP